MTTFSWDEYLKLAQQLAVQTDEASKRSAISRAYYFVFQVARDRATRNGLSLPYSGSVHKMTWDCFASSPDPECKKLGLLGLRLRDRRNKADYDLAYRGRIAEEALSTVTDAAGFAARVSRLPTHLPRV